MSVTNVFFCFCGRQIGRPADANPIRDGDEAIYGVIPWYATPGDAILHGIKCGSCRRNWIYEPAAEGHYVEVTNCCSEDRCPHRWDD